MAAALGHYRICDFTGQLAGAGATKWLAAFGAEVIRIEDPVRQGRWDILRGNAPFKPGQSGLDHGAGFNQHNTDKLGITLNLRTEKAREILTELIRQCDAVTENFAAGVLERWGFGYEQLQAIKPDIVYVSNCGFGHRGPYSRYKTWGPIVQAVSGLTHTSALPDQPPAGWGYSYMDHTGGYYMAMAIMLALLHRANTGEGQWVDLACTEAALTLNGPALLDWTANGRGLREQTVDANRSQFAPMAPHGIYPCLGHDHWIAIACRDDADWQAGFVDKGERTIRITPPGGKAIETRWTMSGAHNLENAVAAVAAACHAGVDARVAVGALAEFKGVKRRLERTATVSDIAIYDDFAHHPTAIRRTLEGLRRHSPGRRIVVALEPRSNTMRLGHHNATLAESLERADRVFLYAPPDVGSELTSALEPLGERLSTSADYDDLVQTMAPTLEPGDIVVFMSNGGFGGARQTLTALLKRLLSE